MLQIKPVPAKAKANKGSVVYVMFMHANKSKRLIIVKKNTRVDD